MLLGLAALGHPLLGPPRAAADAASRVFVNGAAVPVLFHDGDSFRVLGGPYRGSPCRLAGFNTLETFGPVHQWGEWHPRELLVHAVRATRNAQRGVWHCRTDGAVDGYGRLLMDCPDLAVDQLRRGLAHAMEVDDRPARAAYLRAQREAVGARRGMWAKGVPAFVMTSLHSAAEDLGRRVAYNRLVSVRDGHSERWAHGDTYPECTWVCHEEDRVDLARVTAVARRLREVVARPEVGSLHLIEAVARFRRLGALPAYLAEGDAGAALRRALLAMARDGGLGELRRARGACALYVAFERRYGRDRAACLRGEGTRPPPPDPLRARLLPLPGEGA
ncbi:MAG: thermonuclease family protein [Sandaracinaceae bacterium]